MISTLLKDGTSALLGLGISYPLLPIVTLRIFRLLGSSFIVLWSGLNIGFKSILLSGYNYGNRNVVIYFKGNLNSSYDRDPIYILVRCRIDKPGNKEFSSDGIRSTLSSSESTVV
jgi:hypothetical protein